MTSCLRFKLYSEKFYRFAVSYLRKYSANAEIGTVAKLLILPLKILA
jgi:hypothetical protein